MATWRWDQGRTEYFRFDNIKSIAQVLLELEGTDLSPRQSDGLRSALVTQTGLSFPPTNYKVWRNYGRVFETSFLATDLNNVLVLTPLGRKLGQANNLVSVDEYLSNWIPCFYYPFPAYEGYSPTNERVFPACAIIKFLISTLSTRRDASMTVDDVFQFLIGNKVTGKEDLKDYQNLVSSNISIVDSSRRQVRELLVFISQLSFLKWHRNRLFLDILPGDLESIEAISKICNPSVVPQKMISQEEIIQMGSIVTPVNNSLTTFDITRRQPADVVFTEGSKTRITHLRIERSPYLRQWLFRQMSKPYRCHMCMCILSLRYPWTDNILEVHHLLPLSSTLIVSLQGTSLADVVALCPNCHRSVHAYYKQWLNSHHQEDFATKDQARSVYEQAKSRIELS